MPLRVRIDVNGQPLGTYWIGRIQGGTEAEDRNTYVIGEGTEQYPPWAFTGLDGLSRFKHRYGDGAEVCVRKGLEALELDHDVLEA